MTLDVLRYAPEKHEISWDNWCADADNATFLHTRRFLSYHEGRFNDHSALIFRSDCLVGVLPAAEAPHSAVRIESHPGATYGGLVHRGGLAGERMVEAIEALKDYYRSQGFEKLLYKVTPHIYTRTPSQDDIYALFRHGATRVGCNLSCAIDLAARRPPAERRRRGLKKARRLVTVVADRELLRGAWETIAENLSRKHAAQPVHSLDELTLLATRFPNNVQVRCALVGNRVEAAVILFNSASVWHAQYIGSSEAGYATSALDAVFEDCIAAARESGARYFDFGTSNEAGGQVLNATLYQYKAEFGAGGVAHEFYELAL